MKVRKLVEELNKEHLLDLEVLHCEQGGLSKADFDISGLYNWDGDVWALSSEDALEYGARSLGKVGVIISSTE